MKKIILLGRPNVGKSSIFNALLGRREAIVSEQAGTTRDVKFGELALPVGKKGPPQEAGGQGGPGGGPPLGTGEAPPEKSNLSSSFFSKNEVALLIDSGGLDEGSDLARLIKDHSLAAAAESDLILFIVDGKLAPAEADKKLIRALAKLKKPLALVINKIDNAKDEARAWDFVSFGMRTFFCVSAAHRRGFDELLAWLGEEGSKMDPAPQEAGGSEEKAPQGGGTQPLEESPLQEAGGQGGPGGGPSIGTGEAPPEKSLSSSFFEKNEDPPPIRVGIIGRVNVGKSSLLNALLGQQRALVSPQAGTTIDPVNESVEVGGRVVEFIDTAGLRRRSKILGIEKFALLRAEKILSQSQLALLVLDAAEGFNELDERIASLADKHGLGLIIVLNKWDAAPRQDYDELVRELRLERFKFLAHAPIIAVSAKSGKRISALRERIIELYENYTQRLPTARLNELIAAAVRAHPLPHEKGRMVKIYYATQYSSAPPQIALVMNRPRALHFSYRRYLQNQLRAAFPLSGVPLILSPRARTSSRKTGENEVAAEVAVKEAAAVRGGS